MASPNPVLSLGLRQSETLGNDILQLNRPSFSGYNNLEITTFDTDRPVTLVCSGLDPSNLRLDVAAALRAGLLQLIQQDTQAIVPFPPLPPAAAPGRMEIPPSPSPNHRQALASLHLDSTAQIWHDALQPGASYTLRFAPSPLPPTAEPRCFHASPSPSTSTPLPLRLEHHTSIHFTTHADPAPPVFTATLAVDPPTAHLSGTPPFKFVVDIASTAPHPTTVRLDRTPFAAAVCSASQLVRCVAVGNVRAQKVVRFPAAFGFSGDEEDGGETRFPPDEAFAEVPARGEGVWRFEYVLRPENDEGPGGLDVLEAGGRYAVELAERARRGFGVWMVGGKGEALRGEVGERRERWREGAPGRGKGRVEVRQVGGPVVFDVVE